MNFGITEIFNKLAGTEIQVVETADDLHIGGMKYPMTSARIADNDPTIKMMKDAAAQNGMELRVWFADSIGTMDYDPNRVNVHVVKCRDNKYRVSRTFSIG